MSIINSREPSTGIPPPQIERKRDSPAMNGITRSLSMANEQAWCTLGAIAEQLGDDENTLLSYEKALSHNRNNSKALFAMACCYEKRENFQKASDCFRGVVAMNKQNGEAWGHLGYCYLMQNELHNAYTAYQHALYHIHNPKDPNLWFGIGVLYDRYGSLEHAEEAFDAVLQMEPNADIAQEVKFRLGILAKNRGRLDLALERLRLVLEDISSSEQAGDVWSQIGHVYELKDEVTLAKSSYQKVIEHHPTNVKALTQLGWLCSRSLEEHSLGIEYLTKATSIDPTNGKAWYLLGRCYVAVREFEKGYHAYKQAVNYDVGNPNVWTSLGVLFYNLGQYLDALDAYSRAINLNPNICEVWYNVGMLYDTCNQANDARDAYQKAGDLGADPSFIRTRLENLRAKENGQPIQGMNANPPGPSEPPTTAPMGVGPSQIHENNPFQGSTPAPLMPSPATSGGPAPNPPSMSMNSGLTSSGMQSIPRSVPMSQPMSSQGSRIPTSGPPSSNSNVAPIGRGGMGRSIQMHPGSNPPGRSMNTRGLPMGEPQGGNHGMAQMMSRGGGMPGMMSMPPHGMQMGSQQMSHQAPGRSDGQGGNGYAEQAEKKIAPTRLAGLDPKTMGRGAPNSHDRLPMPSMADSKRGRR